MEGHADVEELADPFSALQFLYAKNWVSTVRQKKRKRDTTQRQHLPIVEGRRLNEPCFLAVSHSRFSLRLLLAS